jgi:hypothetical protein
MQSSPLDNFAVTEGRPIHWYDGLVSGLARLRCEPGWFYVSLLAWSHDVDEQVFAVIPISAEFADRITRLLPSQPSSGSEEQWQAIDREVSKLRSEYRGTVRLIRCRHFGDPIVALAEIDIDALGLRAHIGQDLENALCEEQIEKWIGLPDLRVKT